jgi:adenylate cyclase
MQGGIIMSRNEFMCVLFLDIVDSARLYANLGDDEARRIIVACLSNLGKVVEGFGGTIRDRIGDEILCTFKTAESAALAAIEIHLALEKQKEVGEIPVHMSVRIGFHYGNVIVEDNDIYGDTVYTAKRISTLAKGHQILTSAETVRKHGGSWQKLCRFVGPSTIRGKRGVFEICEVIFKDSSQTIVGNKSVQTRPVGAKLYLAYPTGNAIIDTSRQIFTIGRGLTCDWVVYNEGVSRLHARIVYHNGRFLLIDVSRNGTLVTKKNGTQVFVLRDEHALSEAGTICLVGSEAPIESHLLQYRCSKEA